MAGTSRNRVVRLQGALQAASWATGCGDRRATKRAHQQEQRRGQGACHHAIDACWHILRLLGAGHGPDRGATAPAGAPGGPGSERRCMGERLHGWNDEWRAGGACKFWVGRLIPLGRRRSVGGDAACRPGCQ